MTRRRTHRHRMVAASLLLTAGLILAPDVAASGVTQPSVWRQGVCVGGPTRWRLRVTTDVTGMLLVRFRLLGGATGETWNVFLDHNGTGFFAGSRISGDAGLVRVIRRTHDLPGNDIIRAAGHDVVTGEVCRGRVRVHV